ncbi:penicillin-binding protein activator [Dyella nitratireducens]|uniref:Penicillin-binding protein activator n=1 Tax=Dyella nitratireducens TaxID=1849580 RepID=A0ABQ1GU86_9GAMM|nr:penicillin-binding protein activator [Dyella nitratireducens]GGA50229.1 penicillin-binding protein activator [Dyella nitratireducens]GLQ42558.1 penicillin-binding protein activator [Dyella nitratireducens]
MRPSRLVASGLLLSLLLSACVPSVVPRSPAEVAAAQSAANLANQGQFDQAAQAYLTLAAQASDRADHYKLLAAEAYREENALDRATPIVVGIRRDKLSDDEPVRLDLLRAEMALHQHDPAAALNLTTQPDMSVPANLRPRLLILRADALAGTGDLWGAAVNRIQLDSTLQGADRAQNRDQALGLLTKLGVGPLKQRAAAMQPSDRMLPWVNEALGRLGVTVAQAQPNLQQAVGTLVAGNGASVREGYKMPAHVALLLPNNDGLAPISAAIREGFFAAYFQSSDTHAPRAAVRVYDSGGNAAAAIKAYNQAVSDGAQMVVGPLLRTEVTGVLGQPSLSVPVLALNRAENDKLSTGTASEFALMPEDEGAQAADHMIERGLHNAYVLISGDDFAKRAATAFKVELEAKGGQIAGNAQLPSSGVNYGDAINALNAGSAGTDAGIFISMRPEQARLLLPQLRVQRMNLPVFATSHIYGGSDNPTADRDLEGVEFCGAPWLFDAQTGLPNYHDIAGQLPAARTGTAQLFAFGMDAWNLVPYLDWLRSHPDSYLPGATGQLAVDTFGHVKRVLTWLKFQDGVARPSNGSLDMDNTPGGPAPVSSAPAPASSVPMPATQPNGG